jgi:hypothetical protein
MRGSNVVVHVVGQRAQRAAGSQMWSLRVSRELQQMERNV